MNDNEWHTNTNMEGHNDHYVLVSPANRIPSDWIFYLSIWELYLILKIIIKIEIINQGVLRINSYVSVLNFSPAFKVEKTGRYFRQTNLLCCKHFPIKPILWEALSPFIDFQHYLLLLKCIRDSMSETELSKATQFISNINNKNLSLPENIRLLVHFSI